MDTKERCWCVQVQNAYIDAKREGHAQRFAVAREKYIKVHEMELWNTQIITDIAELCIALELWDEAVSRSPSATYACLENIHPAGHLSCPPHTCALLDVPSACAIDILCIPLELWDEAVSPSHSDMTVVACTLEGCACGCSIANLWALSAGGLGEPCAGPGLQDALGPSLARARQARVRLPRRRQERLAERRALHLPRLQPQEGTVSGGLFSIPVPAML